MMVSNNHILGSKRGGNRICLIFTLNVIVVFDTIRYNIENTIILLEEVTQG